MEKVWGSSAKFTGRLAQSDGFLKPQQGVPFQVSQARPSWRSCAVVELHAYGEPNPVPVPRAKQDR